MEKYKQLLLQNKAWAQSVKQVDPMFFERLSLQQNPKFLWIGCSDSRVPADKVTGTEPGEMFVHRNIANMVVVDDLNLLSVLQYAVQVLKVDHVIVCGHYGCGGVIASLAGGVTGHIDTWLQNIRNVFEKYRDEIDSIQDAQARSNRLVELNVQQQVQNLAETDILRDAWKEGRYPYVHGWVYGLNNGLIHAICTIQNEVMVPAQSHGT